MPNIKVVHTSFVAILALLGGLLAACAPPGDDADDDGRPLVITTFTVLADIARNVAGEHLRIESLTKPGAEIHGYEPTPSDIRKAAGADLIVDNGLNLEAWFDQFMESIDAPHVVASEGVEALDITEDAYAGLPNPHAWMSPVNAQLHVDNLVAAFSELDPAHADDFAANGEAYKAQLDAVHRELLTAIEQIPPTQRALVTCEGAFSYLARDAGLTEVYIWPVNAESQSTPQRISDTISYVQTHQVPAVFCESTVSDAPMQQVVEATGASFGGTLYVDSLSGDDGPVPTYLDLIGYDVDLIIEALTSRTDAS